MIARVPAAAERLRSPGNAGMAGITMITLNFLPSLPARTHASTMARPITLRMGFC